MTTKLTAARVREITKPGHHADGGGLYLTVAATGTKSWTLRTTVGGTRVMRGLGSVKKLTLAQARKSAIANKTALRSGGTLKPVPERVEAAKKSDVPTFGQAMEIVHGILRNQWRPSHAKKWLSETRYHLGDALGNAPINEITRAELADLLTPIYANQPATAARLRARLRQIFNWATAIGHCPYSPADDALNWLIAKPPKDADAEPNHRAALHHSEVADALLTVRMRHARVTEKTDAGTEYRINRRITPPTGFALQLAILCATRVGEAAGAHWDEIDWDNRTWTLPASRTKQKATNVIPLSDAAMDVLRHAARQFGGRQGWVFPTKKGTPVSAKALSEAARVLQLGCTMHGFRSSFRDWAAETYGPNCRDAAEKQLGHVVAGMTERAYYRSQLVEERREIMQAWGDYLTGQPF
ncbi:MAG: tyrosine-type recombinase/integrase [Chloroflexi bacterium]|nr:tyrosine-type recombinase/integrase [Chloroflexota bacterium]